MNDATALIFCVYMVLSGIQHGWNAYRITRLEEDIEALKMELKS